MTGQEISYSMGKVLFNEPNSKAGKQLISSERRLSIADHLKFHLLAEEKFLFHGFFVRWIFPDTPKTQKSLA